MSAVKVETIPPGVVTDYAGSTAPNGWLMCFGQEISRTTFAPLFSAIGTTHGAGNGSSTFNVPDCRGRVVAGKDDMGGIAASRLVTTWGVNGTILGAGGGSQSHLLTEAQMPSHNHNHWMWQNAAAGGWAVPVGTLYPFNQVYTTTNTGGSQAHHNVQPTVILNKIIHI